MYDLYNGYSRSNDMLMVVNIDSCLKFDLHHSQVLSKNWNNSILVDYHLEEHEENELNDRLEFHIGNQLEYETNDLRLKMVVECSRRKNKPEKTIIIYR